jgi:hypothetical protein
MNTRELTDTFATLVSELVDGPPGRECYVLNRGDAGLLRSLDSLTAHDASATSQGGASIAAHVDHLRYGLSLMNRWSKGENPFDTADWAASWRITAVSDEDWRRLRDQLRAEARSWLDAVRVERNVTRMELNGIVSSIAHLAYHLGAIRQIARASRGPKEQGAATAWQSAVGRSTA